MTPAERSRQWREEHPSYAADWMRRARANDPTMAERQREWKLANPERIRVYAERYKARKRVVRRSRMLGLYGLTADEYDRLLDAQGGRCAICGLSETKVHHGRVVSLAVDHDHETGRIRGLLCSRCNIVLGLMGETPDLLKAATRYLTPVPKKGK